MRALDHLHDFAVRAAVTFQAYDADRHAVAMHPAFGIFLT